MGRRRDHFPRFDASVCPDAEACARLYHGIGGPDGDDTCECCGVTLETPVARIERGTRDMLDASSLAKTDPQRTPRGWQGGDS